MSEIAIQHHKLFINGKQPYPQLIAQYSPFEYIDNEKRTYQFIDCLNGDQKLMKTVVVQDGKALEKDAHYEEILTYKNLFTDIDEFIDDYQSGVINPKPYKAETKIYNTLAQLKNQETDEAIKAIIAGTMAPYHSFTVLDQIAADAAEQLDHMRKNLDNPNRRDHSFVQAFIYCYAKHFLYPFNYETEIEKYRHQEDAKALLQLIKTKRVKLGVINKILITISLKGFSVESEEDPKVKQFVDQVNGDLTTETTDEDIIQATIKMMHIDAQKVAKKMM